jgi:MFS family permease
MTSKEKLKFYIKNFPLKDLRFLFFIFILIPVQTLFAHNWLTIPLYTSRAFDGFVQSNFEFFVNLNPILIFILTPMVAALTVKKNTYTMMIIGTFVMAVPTFILALGPTMPNLLAYLFIMTIGEAMWQPRFLQWVAEIAPKNMTGIYMGIGQFPWFLTKVVTSLYSGWFLMNYCPDPAQVPPTPMNTEFMWLIYGFIAILTPIGLFLARGWMMKGFKTKHGE